MRLVFFLYMFMQTFVCHSQVYTTLDGQVSFISEAPLEIIKASSDQLQGVLDLDNKTFAFRIYIKSFNGFNSPLQKEHFYENYMEVSEFPLATFKGKILENIEKDRSKYRAKGMLEIHGVSVERIVEISLEINEDAADFYATLAVPLVDHEINLPRIVYQKIAEEILVTVSGSLNKRE